MASWSKSSPERKLALALTLGEIVEDFLDIAPDARDEHSRGCLWNREEGPQFTFDATAHVLYFETSPAVVNRPKTWRRVG
jgi:hypothetical protein